MMLSEFLILFILGLIFGSFLSMLTYRLPRELSLKGRSYCDHCGKKINWAENIPLFSYLLLRGKCKNCHRHISIRYPLLELSTGILFVTTFYLVLRPADSFAFWLSSIGSFSLIFLLFIVVCSIALFVIDLETQLLPDKILIPMLVIISFFCFLLPSPNLFSHIFWGFLSGGFFLLIYLLTKERGMGFGDVKLSFIAGLLLGFPHTIVWILLSFLLGSVFGVVLLLSGKVKLGQAIPFGPFLIGSLLITLAFGGNLFIWYINLLIRS